MTPTELDRLLLELYASAQDAEHFRKFIQWLVERLHSHLAVLHAEGFDRSEARIEQCIGASFEDLAPYEAEHYQDNLWMARGAHVMLREGVVVGDQVATRQEIVKTGFYHGVLKPLDVTHSLGMMLWNGGAGQYSVLTINRSSRLGAYTQEELALIGAIAPHLRNAFAIRRKLLHSDAVSHGLQARLDRSTEACMVIDATGYVHYLNEQATRFLGADRGLSSLEGRLVLADLQSRHEFRVAIRALVDSGTPARIVARDSDGDASFLMELQALEPARADAGPPARVLVSIHELRAVAPLDLDLLREVYALTPAEARAAAALLFTGSPERAAAGLSTSVATVRTQIKATMSKVGVSKQSQLVERLAAIARLRRT